MIRIAIRTREVKFEKHVALVLSCNLHSLLLLTTIHILNMASQDFDPDVYTKAVKFTKTYYRDVYPALEAAQSTASGKYVLITGASQGIGRSMARTWARAGAAGIAICSRKAETLDPVAEELRSISPSANILAVPCDTTKPSDVASFFDKIKSTFGKLDVVIANVGCASEGKIGVVDESAWWNDLTTSVRSTHLAAHHFIRAFGPEPTGTFISLASGVAAITFPSISSYTISKQAVIKIVEFLDVEYPTLRAFSMDPGIVKGIAAMDAFIPFAFDTEELVGAFSIWLASEKAQKCKGGYLHVTWDVDELEKNGDQIAEKGLLKSEFLGGRLGREGGAFDSSAI